MKTSDPAQCCYEQGELETGDLTLRPGGIRLTDRALEVCRFAPGARLLDVGCGPGATVEHLASLGFAVSGVDPSLKLLAQGRARTGLPLTAGRAEALPFGAETADGVFCECVLSVVEEPLRALAEMRRVLAPGGYLVLSDLYDRGGGSTSGTGAVSQRETERRLIAAGFEPVLMEDHTRLLQELAARLIFTRGSFDGPWCGAFAPGAKPGYYLAVAKPKPFLPQIRADKGG